MMRVDTRRLKNIIESQGLTQTILAQEAGLSRAALHAVLNKEKAVVREKTLKGLMTALRLTDDSILLEDGLARYKSLVAEAHNLLDFHGLAVAHADPLPLDDLFVAVRARASPEIASGDDSCAAASEASSSARVRKSRPFDEEEVTDLTLAQCLHRHRRILVRGEPGSGKTTSLRHLARSYAKGSQQKGGYPCQPLIPLFIRLADFAKVKERSRDLDLVQFVLADVCYQEQPDPEGRMEGLLKEELRRGNCVVLLDGLDELSEKAGVVSALRKLVRAYPNNYFVLTSRIVGQDGKAWGLDFVDACRAREPRMGHDGRAWGLGFRSFDLTRWRDEDVREFANRWCASKHGHKSDRNCKECQRRAEELNAAIVAHPRVRAIATNPLMLTILASLHHASVALPRRRVDLYAKVTEVLLESWEATKRSARPGDPLHGTYLEAREYGWLLAALALAMQRGGRVLSPRWWVSEFVQGFLHEHLGLELDEAKDQSDRVIRHLCERSGLLVERGPEVFGFSHRTFQEYFASRGILDEASAGVNRDVVSLIRPHMYHPQWAEIVRLLSAQLPPRQATGLVRSILDDPDPVGRFLKRGLILVLGCLSDGATVADRQVLDEIFAGMAGLGESQWLGITMDVIDALRELEGTRFEEKAEEAVNTILAAAKARLEAGEYLSLFRVARNLPLDLSAPKAVDSPPGKVHRVEVGGCGVRVVSLGQRLRDSHPERWYAVVFALLRRPSKQAAIKRRFIGELADEAASNQKVRELLEGLLQSDRSPSVRAACALALGRAAAAFGSTAELLMKYLQGGEDDGVPWACGVSLRKVAPDRADVRAKLTEILESDLGEDIRAGAALGLAKVVREDEQLRRSVIQRALSTHELPWVRNACIQALEEALGRDEAVSECLIACLNDSCPPLVQRIAAQALARALADDDVEWSRGLVERIEHILVNVAKPCPHALWALERIVEARELHAGLRLEGVLRDSLQPFASAITIAFVFGSVARNAQKHDSDIDLLVMGETRLKQVSGALRTAEQILGRRINPALYTQGSFRQRYQAGDPFLTDIYRKERIFIIGSDDELRELVAERVSP